MTYRQLFEAACAVDPTDSICVTVDTWRHVGSVPGTSIQLRWDVWSTSLGEHFVGHTAEEALQKYCAAHVRKRGPTAALEAVNDANDIQF